MSSQPFFELEKTCPVCQKKFKITRVRSSACVVMRRDTDFYVKYKDINPTYYSIWVCPHCHYAALDKKFSGPLSDGEKKRLSKTLALLHREEPDLSGIRDADKALRAVELALQTAQIIRASHASLASLYLMGAWFARDKGDKELEQKYLEQARDHYTFSYERETLREKISDVRLMYIIGELNRRTGRLREAINWFSRVVRHPEIKREPEIERLARDQWELAREELHRGTEIAADSPASSEEEEKEKAPAATGEKTETGIPFSEPASRRTKTAYSFTLYRDQVEWLQKLSENSAGISRDAVLRALLDAVKETAGPELMVKKAASENEFKELISTVLKHSANS